MSAGPVFRGALFCALLLACGERGGDPVVMLSTQSGAAGSPPAASGTAGMAGLGGEGGNTPSDVADGGGPVGLCGPCTSSEQCGDANDACVQRFDERFCGRDCDEQHGC